MTLQTKELRKLFLDFFRSKDHYIEPSASLVPSSDDKSLLLINAGMAPLKPYFLGLSTPPSTRIVSCQRCLRTNDIDEVGRTPRHLTCFEMLGNFSFGDYFKKEIINWSWEFVREWLKIPEEKLRVSVFETDDEAHEIWEKEVGVRSDWIYRLGEKDNFWFMAETGPCGPDSEIFYDLGEEFGKDQTPATDGDRWVEIWNLVFTQFDRQADGSLKPLPKKNVDTGMGLERTAMALQGKSSVFETDSFKPIIDLFAEKTPKEILENDNYIKAGVNSLYVVADHSRAVSMLIADGVYPGNEGRGYVLRRLLRRALVHLRRLGQPEGGLMRALPAILDMWGDVYPNIVERKKHIEKLVGVEEENFLKTLDSGISRLESAIAELKEKIIYGELAFEMFDTYGIPLDVTIEMAQARGMEVDEQGFNLALEKTRRRSREVTGELLDSDQAFRHAVKSKEKSGFTGYDELVTQSSLVEYNPDHNFVVLDRTPFYAEKGGQAGDKGRMRFKGGEFTVIDTQLVGDIVVHKIDTEKTKGDPSVIKPGDPIEAIVDSDRRNAIRRAHTATHLLHAALRAVLGDHVQQAGSHVEPDRFRFDFSHYQPLTKEETRKIEDWANEQVFAEYDVHCDEVPIDEAKKAGAMALFGEKYGEIVRMVRVGGLNPSDKVSIELCGGTHVNNTGVIGQIRIISEESVASGVRRIEAYTGQRSYEVVKNENDILDSLSKTTNLPVRDLELGVSKLGEQLKKIEKEKKELEQRLLSGRVGQALDIKIIGKLSVFIVPTEPLDPETVAKMLDSHASSILPFVGMAVSDYEGSGTLIIRCNDSAITLGIKAGDLMKKVAPAMGGKGGGKPTFARGSADASKFDEGKSAFIKAIEEIIDK
ncbi:MAG: alanine--tRNA ligase [bacterium]